MKQIELYINERLHINKDTGKITYTCKPKDYDELRSIIRKRLAKNKNANLNDIDVSKMIDMGFLFCGLDPHNINISEWNTWNVISMHEMFKDCKNFNCDLSKWNVENVEDMFEMFYGCENFEGEGLENWNPKDCKNHMQRMFIGCSKMIKNKPNWYKK